ncbi:MAG: hypothetical protein LBS03_02670 [Bacteroidales bacterium]|nr:hypothetical protein [Bacteroidales bacterium]
MKNRFRIVLFSVAVVISAVMPCGCGSGSDDDEGYETRVMVTDVTQAYLYYWLIFREAENAWALVHEAGYAAGETTRENGRSISYQLTEGGKGIVSVVFDGWRQHTAILSGTMTVDLPVDKDSYRQNGRVSISLSKFSINGQQVTGFATITFSAAGEIDQYAYSLTEAAIYDSDDEQILITCSMSGGRFQRIDGSATTASPEDDLWAFNGNMTGMLHNQSSLKYTNTVDNSHWLVYEWGCDRKAMNGYCRLTAAGRTADYRYGDACDSAIEVKTLTRQ